MPPIGRHRGQEHARAANGAVQRIVEAATELVRERSYAELNVGEIMERAGIGRTLFYRHFDDLGDLLLRVAAEAIDELFETQVALAEARLRDPRSRPGGDPRGDRAAGRRLRAATARSCGRSSTPRRRPADRRRLAPSARALRRAGRGAARAGRPSSSATRRPTPPSRPGPSTGSTRPTCSTPSAASPGSRPRSRPQTLMRSGSASSSGRSATRSPEPQPDSATPSDCAPTTFGALSS